MIEEIDMMKDQIETAGYSIDGFFNESNERWHVHLEGDGCFAGTTNETHAYLSGALAIHHRVEYLADKTRSTRK